MTLRRRTILGVVVALTGRMQGAPRWSEFAGIRLRQPVDEVVALGADCQSTEKLASGGPDPQAIAEFAFALSLPHFDHDKASTQAALGNLTMCRLPVLGPQGGATIVAIDRVIVGATVYFPLDSAAPLSLDSMRVLLRGWWGRPTAPAPTLDSWLGTHFRGYLIARQPPRGYTGPRRYQVVLLDVDACTAFDRRVHRASHRGTPSPC